MKKLLLPLICLLGVSAYAQENPTKIICDVGNTAALKGPGYPGVLGKLDPSENTAQIKLGDWSEEGQYVQATSGIVQYGFTVNTESELTAAQQKYSDFKSWTSKYDFQGYLAKQKATPNALNYFINASLADNGINFVVLSDVNTFNMTIGLLPPYQNEAIKTSVSYANLEAPLIVDGLAITCRSQLPANKASYEAEIKRLKAELKKIK